LAVVSVTALDQQIEALSTLQLALIVQCAPERRVLWTRLERAAAGELDRRLAPGVSA
jgi:hypothetical protein